MGLFDWFRRRKKKVEKEVSIVEEAPEIKGEHVEEKPKRKRRKKKESILHLSS